VCKTRPCVRLIPARAPLHDGLFPGRLLPGSVRLVGDSEVIVRPDYYRLAGLEPAPTQGLGCRDSYDLACNLFQFFYFSLLGSRALLMF
jgi:hypothetical protein